VKLCKMKARDGEELVIQAGVSVTVTLPFGTPEDVKKELKFLVENGPKNGLILGLSSSLVPGVKWENIKTLIEGLNYYRIHGRKG
jgi:uroporphyrinogen decarboxylase